MTPSGTGRRAEYAAATRQAILLAARQLFTERGYFETRVEDIARAARVASPTVYAAVGGKSGLLRTLIEDGVRAAESGDIYERIAAQADADELLGMIVGGTRNEFEKWAPLMRQAMAAAPQDAGIRETVNTAHASLRQGLDAVATRLGELDALRPDVSVERAADILWYFLNNASYFALLDDRHWSLDQAVGWLHECLNSALLPR
ncbi:TetR/AcrR family transcriptional regulator [Kineosporia succinea]|uniref:AcrR family transcriptional regulator n=1 Tax=Kineosporia succinea TaxID=84632 RepID=A0ABT9PA84_9ACTN|nr:TetR/AcrR family transcriptional regulator [Kineosporia succinea]MDP9829602.1 AcrR family transcriptional regulator [Kineosporia succinea]